MGWGPRGLFEERTFDRLPAVVPDAGDVLICKVWAVRHRVVPHRTKATGIAVREKDEDHFYIRTGQALFSRMPHGSRNSEHAALCVGTEGATRYVCEANGGGVRRNRIEDRDMVVYRCTHDDLRNEAVNVALTLTGHRARADGATLQAADYSWDKAEKSVFKSKKVMAKGRAYLQTLLNKVYGNDYGDPPPMFCSEFVTACYELAAIHLKRPVRMLDVDPRAISPKALESLLERSPGWFRKVGRVSDSARPVPPPP